MINALLLLGVVLAPAPSASEAANRRVLHCIDLSIRDVGAAVVECEAAATAARRLGEREMEATALAFRAGCLSWIAQWDEGLRDGYRALELARDLPDSLATRHASLVLGAIHRERGDARQALQHLRDAIAKAARTRDPGTESLAHSVLARTLFWLGDYAGARTETDRARDLGRAAKVPYAEFFASWQRGMTELESRRLDAANTYMRAALQTAQSMGFDAGVANMHVNIADLSVESGELAAAVTALDAARTLIQQRRAPELFGPYLDETEGRLLAARGQHRLAAVRFERAASRGASPWLQARALVGRARALRDQSLDGEAVAAYQRAIEAVEATRADTPADAQRATYMAANLAPYRELIALLWATGGPPLAERAFEVSEAARARALRDALAAAGRSAQVARPVTVATLQERLTAADLFIEYLQAGQQLFAFAVSKSSVRWVAISDGTDERVRFLHGLGQQDGPASRLEPVARRLFDDLLAPLLEGVAPEVSNLIISADGVLHQLPFEVLQPPPAGRRSTASPPVVNRYVIQYSPSAALLFRDRANTTSSMMLAVSAPATLPVNDALARLAANGAGPLRPLTFSGHEAATAFQQSGGQGLLLTSATAQESTVKRAALSTFGRLHFATHAIVNTVVPQHSALMLGSSDGEDGLLEASEIYALDLHADLVVLSACDTGMGQLLGGEGTQSLARAFLQAGAQRVISTLWPIEDRQSVVFMSRFYRALANGDRPAMALTAAKRASQASGMPARVWAAFVLTGPPDPVVTSTAVPLDGPLRVVPVLCMVLSMAWLLASRARHIR
jgi:CHAT domain-containing protein